uniref:30S ribosomal protein S10, chloroplastic n=1 Tax=Neogoniolithon spectabile TaxID=231755 RepID=A0A3G3MGQ0_9FLOR|nr:ribosomal protein S10 [Neogoniolithon spectabile]AYR06009.1 ribosomal protein S10 [Neogoniolithon spectabile]
MQSRNRQTINIKLKSYNHEIIKESCQQIIETVRNTRAYAIGPIPLPTKNRKYCILRSPHVDKDSREHFEVRTHSRIIEIDALSSQTVDALMKLNIKAGVEIEVKI